MARLTELQQVQLDFMQKNLRRFRSICEWSGSDLADVLGLTRQTVNNLETDKSRMTPVLFLAIGAMLEKYSRTVPDAKKFIDACLTGCPHEKEGITSDSILESWFATFPKQFPDDAHIHTPLAGISSMRFMENIGRDYKIFLCPDALLVENSMHCIEDLAAFCKEHGNSINLPAYAFFNMQDSLEKEALLRLKALHNEGGITLRGAKGDPPLQRLLMEKFLSFKVKYRLCLITNNRDLAEDMNKLNTLRTLSGFPILLLKITSGGYLGAWMGNGLDTEVGQVTEETTMKDPISQEDRTGLVEEARFEVPDGHESFLGQDAEKVRSKPFDGPLTSPFGDWSAI